LSAEFFHFLFILHVPGILPPFHTHTRQAYAVTKQNCEHSVNQLYCVYIPAGHSDLLNIVGTTYCLADTIKYLIPHTHTLVWSNWLCSTILSIILPRKQVVLMAQMTYPNSYLERILAVKSVWASYMPNNILIMCKMYLAIVHNLLTNSLSFPPYLLPSVTYTHMHALTHMCTGPLLLNRTGSDGKPSEGLGTRLSHTVT